MKSLVHSATEILSEGSFRKPLSSVVTQHAVAKYYGCLLLNVCKLDLIELCLKIRRTRLS